tara:strand:- start:4560 stop:5783 length:1224 start_codon:yes stop_codon:yes gene_type:complete
MICRHCKNTLTQDFVDLGFAPPSNAYLKSSQMNRPETYYPLKVMFCTNCSLVQTVDFISEKNLFEEDYAYFSSISKSWLEHAENFSSMITEKLKLKKDNFVIELASNDGYLLKNFVKKKIPCLGVEPTISAASESEKKGIQVIKEFFSENLSKQLVNDFSKADLIIANNVYAHIPDINDFTRGLKILLKENGTITVEIAYLKSLIEKFEFDTIYHEHFSYHSLYSIKTIFEKHNLKVYDCEILNTHGGSLRVYGCHDNFRINLSDNVKLILKDEEDFGLLTKEVYENFQNNIYSIKNNFLSFLIKARTENAKVIGYGAAAKGNTLLNFCGIKKDLISYVCDASPSKQGKYLPGSHIPIFHPNKIKLEKPEYIIILPWNISQEIMIQLSYVREWGAKFVTVIPQLNIN